jgi:formamidopyrimidine-DNA glycosylase
MLVFRDVRRFGRIAVVARGDHRSLPTLAGSGPEPLGDDFTPESLHRALGRSRRAVKTQLLSQRPVAGVGNIYADEALWLAGIDPTARSVSRPRAVALHAAIREVIAAGIRHGGTTLRDYVDADGSSGSNQHHLRCYGRAGEPCERCGELLRRRVVDARGTTWCPRCQRRR